MSEAVQIQDHHAEPRQWISKVTIRQLLSAKTPPYQAPLQLGRVNAMAREFDPAKFGVPEVLVDPDGIWWLHDGQHRSEAGRIAGYLESEFYALFTAGVSMREAAQHFLGINNRKGKPRGALILAQAEAGDPLPALMMQIASKHGFSMELVKDSKRSRNHINCPDTLLKMLQQSGADHVDIVIGVVRSAWDGHEMSTVSEIFKGISQFVLAYPEVGSQQLASRLGSVLPKEIRYEIKTARHAEDTSPLQTKGYGYGRGVLAIWNHGRRGNRLDDRFNDFDLGLKAARSAS